MSSIQQDKDPRHRRVHALMHSLSEQTDIPQDKVMQLLALWEQHRPYPTDFAFSHDHPIAPRALPLLARGMGDCVFGAEPMLPHMREAGVPNMGCPTPSGGMVVVFAAPVETGEAAAKEQPPAAAK